MTEAPRVIASDRAWIEVDLGAIARNADALARQTKKPLMPMVKADAYGLGVREVVKALEPGNPWGYGVATITEGEELRALGITRPILVTIPPMPSDFAAIRAAKLTPSLSEADQIVVWVSSGGGDWHLAIDTGMNRAGIRWDRVGALADVLRSAKPTGAFTHFHSSEFDNGTMELQTKRFHDAIAALPAKPALLHAENSGAVARTSPSPWSFVRPGVFLYGVGSGAALKPEPVVGFYAQVVDLRDLDVGDTVSYEGTWTAKRPTRIATVGAGYADGYRRSLGNAGTVLIGGKRAPIVGTVTMDMLMVDVTDIECDRWALATLIGRDGDEEITVEDVAKACKLSPYEMLTGLRSRAPRVYR